MRPDRHGIKTSTLDRPDRNLYDLAVEEYEDISLRAFAMDFGPALQPDQEGDGGQKDPHGPAQANPRDECFFAPGKAKRRKAQEHGNRARDQHQRCRHRKRRLLRRDAQREAYAALRSSGDPP